ncbi:MAG: DUF2079 domain-containing protein [Nitrososphaerota archaeon]|jgi:uncharacterized membrane protein|nr:DUF2079 domain-containing protein [Nitrososphaerota archaeon]
MRKLYVRLTLLSELLIYSVYWSYITVMKFFAGNANVFDLGLFMEFGWEALHQVHTISAFLFWFSYNGIIYVISPITLLGSYPAILILQSAFIGLGALPLFGIAKHYLKDDMSALLLSASYLLYFPLAGVNWYDAHYQAFFPTLFLLGYYFFVKDRYRPALAFLILSSMVRYPYFIFPFIFAVIVLIEQSVRHLRSCEHSAGRVYLSIAVIVFGAVLSLLYYFFYAHGSFAANFAGTGTVVGTVRLYNGAVTYMLDTKVFTVLLFLAPLLFLPVLSKRWAILYVPLFYLVFTSNYWGYTYPYLFMLQYPAGIVPFLYLGLIEGAAWLGRDRKRRLRVISIVVLVSVLISASAFQPYGPFNSASGMKYDIGQQTNANMKVYGELNTMISLINKSDPYVLFQSNVPQVLPRPLKYLNTPLITNIQEVTYDLMHVYPNGTSVPVRVDYVLSDPYSGYYYTKQGPPYNASMYDFIREFYGSQSYGLLAEASGMMLLERNYMGSVKYFVPLDQSFNSSQIFSSIGQSNSTCLNFTDINSPAYTIAWYGPYTTLYPGTYTATYWLYTDNSNNSVLLQVTANGGAQTLISRQLGPGSLKTGTWNQVNLTFYSNGVYSAVEFRGLISHYNGTLLLGGISLTQVGPGLPNANDLYVYPGQLDLGDGTYALTNGSITAVNESNEMAWYGPYTTLQPGHYLVKYMLSTTNSSPYNRAMLQVTSNSGNVVLGEQGITGAYTAPVQLCINGTTTNVEFRGYVENWQGNLTLNGIEIIEAGPEVNYTYPAYGLYSTYYTNGTISGTNNEMAWYGPYTTLCPGDYSVTFWLNGSASVNLQVTAGYGSVYLASNTVHVSGPGRFTLNFTVSQEEQYVEFRGYVINGSVELEMLNVSGQFAQVNENGFGSGYA